MGRPHQAASLQGQIGYLRSAQMQPGPAVCREAGAVGGEALRQLLSLACLRQEDEMVHPAIVLHLHA